MDSLHNCPVCGYSLHGLPDMHQCPECGFNYDKRMQVFDQSPALAIVLGIFVIVAVLLAIFDSGNLKTFSGIAGLVGVFSWHVWYVSQYSFKKRNRAVVGADRIYLISAASIVEEFNQGQIAGVRLRARSVEFRFLDSLRPINIGDEFFGSHKRLMEFFSCVENALGQPASRVPVQQDHDGDSE